MAATSQARPILRSLSSRSIGLLVCVIGIWAIFAAAVAATRTPWSNEAWAANPAVTLVDNGHLGTTILESKDTWLQGIDQHMYWMMPLHSLAQAAWYRCGRLRADTAAPSIRGIRGIGPYLVVRHHL